MAELGFDIHEEILVRSQVNDLIRCKSVCKSWNSLISSRCFVKSHLNRHSNEIGDTRIIVSNGATNKGKCQLVGSSNGLVCISRRHCTDFLVVNPSTREVKELRNPPLEYHVEVLGFGYDSSIDDFKVVIGYRVVQNDNYMFEVLELKTNIWRRVEEKGDYAYFFGNGILSNGAIHWLDQSTNQSVIVSFDLSEEVFKEIPLPKLDDQYDSWTLGTMKHRLCIFPRPHINNLSKNKEMEIWVRRNYNAQESWERKLPPPGYDANKITMDYIPHRNFLSGHVHIWLLEEGSGAPVLVRSIDHPHGEDGEEDIEGEEDYTEGEEDNEDGEEYIRHEHIPLSTYSECNYNYDDHVFVKSLVSPSGMGDGDGVMIDNINDVIS